MFYDHPPRKQVADQPASRGPQHRAKHRHLPDITVALLGLLIALFSIGSAVANEDAPPSRVGRISFVEGDVSFFADRSEGWRKALLNFPVTSRNSVWTNGPGRAEVRIGAAALRLDGDSILDFTQVDESRTDLFLQRGTLNVRARSYGGLGNAVDNDRVSIRVETNEGPLVLQGSGRYRIDAAQERNETRVAVFVGQARFDTGAAKLTIEAGKALLIRVSNGATSFSYESAAESGFDRWAEARDQRWDETHRRYAGSEILSPRMTGYEDLDANGDWVDDREYGRIWAPRLAVADWAPYRYGSWSYVRPWGWTWIDNAAWGFAPFHYGRWVQLRSRWYWWPGAYTARPVYAPALVGWYGRGNWGVSVSVGTPIGWFPLGPREHFVPGYSSNQTYIRNINNITNNITIVNPPARYINQGVGSTIVNNRVVTNGEPVWRAERVGRREGAGLQRSNLDTSATGQGAAFVPPTPVRVTTAPAAVGGETPWPQPNAMRQLGEPARPMDRSRGGSPTPTAVLGEAPRPDSRAPISTYQAPQASQSQAGRQIPYAGQDVSAPVSPALPMARPIKPNPTNIQPQPTLTAPPASRIESTAVIPTPAQLPPPAPIYQTTSPQERGGNEFRRERRIDLERERRHEGVVQTPQIQPTPRATPSMPAAVTMPAAPTATASGGHSGAGVQQHSRVQPKPSVDSGQTQAQPKPATGHAKPAQQREDRGPRAAEQ